MAISPACTVNGSATPPAIAVAGGSTVTIALANSAGVQYWSIACTSTDELNTAAAVNATLVVNMGAKTATFTAPAGLGSAVIFTSTVGISNIGIDQNKVVQPSFSTTFKVNVATSGSAVVMAANETLEQLAMFGWIGIINAFIRSGGGGGGGFTAGGDLSGTSTDQTVIAAQNGEITFSTGGTEQWAAGATWLMSQASTTGATGANSTWQPQQSTNANPTGGNAVVALQAASGSGSEAAFQVTTGGHIIGQIAQFGGQTSLSVTNGQTPISSNQSIISDGASYTYFSSPGALGLLYADATFIQYMTTAGIALFTSTLDLGGGSGILSFGPAATIPASFPSSNVGLYNSTGQTLGLNAKGITVPSFVTTPTISQSAPTTDVATTNLTISAQGADTSATTHIAGGVLNLSSGVGVTQTTAIQNAGVLNLQAGGTTIEGVDGYSRFMASTAGIALTNANVTLTATQMATPYMAFTGSLTGSVVITLVASTLSGFVRTWLMDLSGITFSSHTITFKIGSGSTTVVISALTTNAQVIQLFMTGANSLVSTL
jgi:hypothetical protein